MRVQIHALGRDIGDGCDLKAPVGPQESEGFAEQLVLVLIRAVHDLGDRVAGPHLVIEIAVSGDVDMLVQGRAGRCLGLMLAEHRQVASGASKAWPQGRT